MSDKDDDFGGCAYHFMYSPNCDACRIRAGQQRKYADDESEKLKEANHDN